MLNEFMFLGGEESMRMLGGVDEVLEDGKMVCIVGGGLDVFVDEGK